MSTETLRHGSEISYSEIQEAPTNTTRQRQHMALSNRKWYNTVSQHHRSCKGKVILLRPGVAQRYNSTLP